MLLLVLVGALAAATAGCERKGGPSGPQKQRNPGESADAAAAGSGYGVGRPNTNTMLGDNSNNGQNRGQGASPLDPAGHPSLKADGGRNPSR